jgi:hypothetical protein
MFFFIYNSIKKLVKIKSNIMERNSIVCAFLNLGIVQIEMKAAQEQSEKFLFFSV